ncbi:hypothetical protein KL905_003837 [Ogataea polymorpha]|uniref:Vacuolar-sorting protein SNF7 n=1 Tax=Ogataea polymorpha TaxID=460523 RepID=A0A1B7SFD1_9ASCO|nr:uncharacterized protein OGAPODRAFT_13973 [Ogataea polymorpha]KAG7878322.1 hypothetical protein KL937_004064 [Ogataea polymorpha]KAG7890161.1 hypothetical protein KL908_004499 [Ogataea polymorpha]KAG7895455.1 hypothetical protein KL936_000163 [Ogataea polymorpha]KAG7898679.1 hypothetical protein KL935_004278 [Ogataea polymorpha]KAG7901644.1 hypothetical protein KL907_004314 [Ogataea polymorpha]
MWGYFFGGNAKQKKELPKKAIVELREHISTLNKKSAFLETQVQEQDAIARKNITTNKNLAKMALKKKKKLEADILKIENQVESLETQLNAIESANLNLETMKAMKQGAKAMKQMHGDFNVDKVDQTMDDIREQVELSEEISDAISRPLGNDLVDEDELDEELAALQQEELDNKMTDTKQAIKPPAEPVKSQLPDAPTGKVQEEEEDEDEKALRELQAEMGM